MPTTIRLSEHEFGIRILGRDIRLSATEHGLIRTLLANRDRVFEQAELAEQRPGRAAGESDASAELPTQPV